MARKPRSIFEDVSTPAATPAPAKGGMIGGVGMKARRAIRAWMMVLFALVVGMIVVGGATRLTDSGLSITEWRPVTGALPPMSEAAWQDEFDKYRQIAQYQLVNKGMSLEDFKFIYWWEWGHRQLGRVVGLVWALGFVGFWLTKRIPTGWTGRMLLLGALGGTQGAIGWWMVSSGVGTELTSVASYRLATHLGLAFVILGFLAWYMFLLGRSEPDLMTARRAREGRLFGLSTGLMHFAFLQILIGALVAGIDAGRAFPTWPDMNGAFFPPNAFYVPDGGAVWRAFFENEGLVQFIHRMVGYVILALAIGVWFAARRSARMATKRAFDWVLVAIFAQMVLGIVTVMHSSPWYIAIWHQLGAVAVLTLVLRARFLSMYPMAQSVKGAKA